MLLLSMLLVAPLSPGSGSPMAIVRDVWLPVPSPLKVNTPLLLNELAEACPIGTKFAVNPNGGMYTGDKVAFEKTQLALAVKA